MAMINLWQQNHGPLLPECIIRTLFSCFIFVYFPCRSPITRINYAAAIKNIDNHMIKKPTQADLDQESPLETCGCQGKKLRKLYIKGAKSSQDYEAIKESLSTAWLDSNQGKYIWATSSKKVHLNIHRMCRFRSACACSKYHLGLCSPFIHSVVSNDSVSGQGWP